MAIRSSFLTRALYEYVVPQIFVWALINTFQATFTYLFLESIAFSLGLPRQVDFGSLLLFGLTLAVFHGTILGIASFAMSQLFIIARSVSRIVIIQTVLSLGVFFLTFYGVRQLIVETSFLRIGSANVMDMRSWRLTFWLLFLHYGVGSLVVTFASDIVKKYGQDIIVPMLLGAYRKPKAENRIFMFLDLKSSTSLAETLGHLRYSELVQNFIIDINRCLPSYRANIYQYAGDEIVITWRSPERNMDMAVAFFFACREFIAKRSSFYIRNYGAVPEFKAGMDCGVVTAVEIGDVKRDIAYHGDTLNTASRIQSLCNATNSVLLASEAAVAHLRTTRYAVKSLGPMLLKGKENHVAVWAIKTA